VRYRRPVILFGNGARGADLTEYMDLNVPVLTSWQAKDLVDNTSPNYYGCPGVYGNRAANKILHGADMILAVGNRMSIWNVGYEGPRPDQQLVMVDLDEAEVRKFPHAEWINEDAKDFLRKSNGFLNSDAWVKQCREWGEQYPWIESPTHDDKCFINSYRFTDKLQSYFSPGEVIVTEMGAALMAHQVLRIKPPQRLMTSGGLGEMGCGFPAAIGASFARNKGRVICLSTDGGAMMNLQELQTIVHHKLPVKIIVFNNSGYGMIKHTQDNAGMKHAGIDEASGVSFPNFRHVALAFGITASEVRTWADFERIIPSFLKCEGPGLVDFIMDPRQKFQPKLEPVFVDGKPTSPSFAEMSPCLSS
jgi:acetolactate synthase I/II/III large subunit